MKRLWIVVAVLALGASACNGDKQKEPLSPDNPNADPLMMDAGEADAGPTGN